ncbi:MAG TPA: flavodoxin-dependent (E)-4-hydroxy-3-methylbut-2-enyl-diphosphate synthase [Thermomicrobiales bacterium]|nr:flavodoxin-dependent (E)-4-hydroxy-3-methylbut-2-enyl-diphosphate synthase [Thermomicrobiales bacterium]
MLPPRRKSRQVRVGDVLIGGNAPISVQSMTTTDTADVEGTLDQIARLVDAGVDIVRVAVPDKQAAAAVPELVRRTPVPLIADIHFDYRLALAALDGGIHGLRLNPGNIEKEEYVRQVVAKAQEREVPIRIGVNFGSIPKISKAEADEITRSVSNTTELIAEQMVRGALKHVRILEQMDYRNIKISLKAFDVPTMIEAYTRIATRVDYPLHLGVTEAGTPKPGSIRSAVGIGHLLALGIGDTIRVSLAGDPVEEVVTGFEILKSLNLRQRGATMVACPTCGRVEIDLIALAERVEQYLTRVATPIKVAVMGCVVNGPGESKDADIGVAGGRGKGVIFAKGEIVRTCAEAEILPTIIEEINKLAGIEAPVTPELIESLGGIPQALGGRAIAGDTEQFIVGHQELPLLHTLSDSTAHVPVGRKGRR